MKTTSEELEHVLRLLPGPVALVGAVAGGVMGGLTASWLTRVSENPPLLLVAIGRERFTWQLLNESSVFSVSLLAEDQVAEARLFGLQSRRDIDKWSQVDHDLLGDGVPALRRCTARFLCEITGRFPCGDHDGILGRVIQAEKGDCGPPLPLRGADYAPGR